MRTIAFLLTALCLYTVSANKFPICQSPNRHQDCIMYCLVIKLSSNGFCDHTLQCNCVGERAENSIIGTNSMYSGEQ
ncbi:hypothetical protein QE152_g15990 [Popillia japonica]|uniref:Uncharacterized protein n=1 Tax=Popillia japonica TaxID=7064 RepID=A0AAW1L5C5_POPJA